MTWRMICTLIRIKLSEFRLPDLWDIMGWRVPSASPWRQTGGVSHSCLPGRRNAPNHPTAPSAGQSAPSAFLSEPPGAPSFPSRSITHTQAEKWQCVKSMLYTHTQNLVKGCISQSRFVNTHQLLLSRKHERKEWGRKAKQLSIKLHVKDQIFMYTKDRNGNLRARKGQNVVLLWLKLNFWTFVWSYTRFRCLLGLGRNVL